MSIFVTRLVFACLIFLMILASIINFRSINRGIKTIYSNLNPPYLAWTLLFIGILVIAKKSGEVTIINNIYQLFFVSVAGVIILVSFVGKVGTVANISTPIFCLLLYGLFGIISGFYSPNEYMSLYKALLVMLNFLICILVLSYVPRYSHAKILINLTYMFYIALLLSVIVGALFSDNWFRPSTGIIGFMLRGYKPAINPNTLGYISGALVLVFVNRLFDCMTYKEKLLHGSFLISSLTVIILSQSRTCIGGVIVALSALLILKKKYLLLWSFVTVALLIIILPNTISHRTFFADYFRRGQSEQNYKTWSGRKIAWNYSWERFKESPILGYGFDAGVRFGAVSESFRGSHLHSSYFEVLLNSGLLGFIPWLFCLFSVSVRILHKSLLPPQWFTGAMKSFHFERTALLIYSLVTSIARKSFVIFDYTFLLFTCFIVYTGVITRHATFTLPSKSDL